MTDLITLLLNMALPAQGPEEDIRAEESVVGELNDNCKKLWSHIHHSIADGETEESVRNKCEVFWALVRLSFPELARQAPIAIRKGYLVVRCKPLSRKEFFEQINRCF